MKNPAELSDEIILTLAQEKIRDPVHWAKYSFATDKHRVDLGHGWNDEAAVAWCAAGAIASVMHIPSWPYDDLRFMQVWDHLRAYPPVVALGLVSGKEPGSAADFNNRKQHHEVMEMFDFARAHAREAVAA
jgi:hypothetical protein